MMKLFPLSMMILATPAIAQTSDDMLLVCEGATLANLPESDTSVEVADNRGYSVSGRAETRAPTEVSFVARLRIEGGDARMNLPAFAAPVISSSKGGWYRVKDLEVGERRITGKVVYNFLSSSSFEIDRVTGAMTSEGGFQAVCRAEDLSKRAF